MGKLRKAQFTLCRLAEPRALLEWQSFYALRPLLKTLPQGDGHPVIVFPGFGGSDRSTRPMRDLLNDLGYQSHGWGLGSNILFDHSLEDEMLALVKEVAENSGQKVSLIGWSLGGVYARELAKSCPDQVRCVISLGSPISGDSNHSNASRIYQAINGKPSQAAQVRRSHLNEAPPVPTTSIYSKTDGIVAWEGSVQHGGEQTENIEVPASHLGIGVNPLVMYLLAERLLQSPDNWQPFENTGLRSLVFRKPGQCWPMSARPAY
ncbi:alpha/beta hydrolase [Pseudomaricurvus alkylphenolicus]|uniref:esterase/lipase family protein n=1 Tax=Pseudomaricurvus alkylphenolicus TaxID=1306991 RepID=UPI00141F5828|nr:alpha/beta hydrolase [Pseudomaricurvus alkylphenolicus]NIB39921.1 alpha/beta hydrolase [Pseudomaricurvus alkylphenolicus]